MNINFLIRLSALLIAVLGINCSVMADAPYNGPAVYGLKGDVKCVSTTPEPIFSHDKVEFTKEGLIKNCWLTFDNDGVAVGSDQNTMGRSLVTSIRYNDAGQPVEFDISGNMGFRQRFHAELTYAGDVPVKTVIVENNTKNPKQYVYEFSGYEYDDRGNWTERKVNLTVSDPVGKDGESTENFIEKRTIEYYE